MWQEDGWHGTVRHKIATGQLEIYGVCISDGVMTISGDIQKEEISQTSLCTYHLKCGQRAAFFISILGVSSPFQPAFLRLGPTPAIYCFL